MALQKDSKTLCFHRKVVSSLEENFHFRIHLQIRAWCFMFIHRQLLDFVLSSKIQSHLYCQLIIQVLESFSWLYWSLFAIVSIRYLANMFGPKAGQTHQWDSSSETSDSTKPHHRSPLSYDISKHGSFLKHAYCTSRSGFITFSFIYEFLILNITQQTD